MFKPFFGKFHCIRQHDITDCGAACLATIARQYGLKIPVTKIRELACTDRQGTSAYGLVKAAEKLGFAVKGVKSNREEFLKKFSLPAVAHVIIDQSLLHYVVIHRITNKEVLIADPAKGLVTYTHEKFFEIWTGNLILMVPSPQFQKGDQTKGLFTRFLKLLYPQKKLVLVIFMASLIYAALGILGAFYFKFLMDDIFQNNHINILYIVSIGFIFLTVIKILLNAYRTQLLIILSQKLDISLILGYYKHVTGLPMNFFGTRKIGEIISRFVDASKVLDAISGATLTIMLDTLMAIAGGIILYRQNNVMFGITLLVAGCYAVIVFMFNQPLRNINHELMEQNAQLTSYLVESLNGIETVKSFNAETKANQETENKFLKFLKSAFKVGSMSNLQLSLTGFLAGVGGIAIFWVGGINVIQGKMTVGELFTFNALLAYFLEPIKNLIDLQPMLQTAIVASDRLGEILDLELEKSAVSNKKLTPASLKGAIELKNVDFRYGARALVLKNINLKVEPGEKIALVGESGSGKTTLVRLLMRFFPWEKGDILINGYNIDEINLDHLRERIAFISQETFLFSGTVKENLSLGNQDLTLDEIIAAAKIARAHDFINESPLGYNSMLEENGANLSGGQRQRLAITRAILKKPEILIMDEATSNLDSVTEKAIEKTIDEFSKGLTTIIIAHRLSTIMRCDKIYVMDKGEIVESGSHQELIRKKGKYYHLWKEQLPGYTETEMETKAELG